MSEEQQQTSSPKFNNYIYSAIGLLVVWGVITIVAADWPVIEELPVIEEVVEEERIVTIDMAEQRADELNPVRSLIIQQNGDLLYEQYFDGQRAGSTMNLKSASKSLIGLLVGIAIDEGFIEDQYQPIHEFFPEYYENITDSVKWTITVENLLQMRAGLETTSNRNYGPWVVSRDWVRYALEQPMDEAPGEEMIYSTGSSHLLSVIIERASGMSTRQFAQRYLFGPLDIEIGEWQRDPQGYYFGGNNMAMRPNDLLKIGQMLLDGGEYNGQEILSDDWIRSSFEIRERDNRRRSNRGYGYLWWHREMEDYQVFFALGHGGQYLFMVPELNSVVVMTSELTPQGGSMRERGGSGSVYDFMEEYVIPILENNDSPSS